MGFIKKYFLKLSVWIFSGIAHLIPNAAMCSSAELSALVLCLKYNHVANNIYYSLELVATTLVEPQVIQLNKSKMSLH